ncbi:MAG: sigma-54 dependent transcriptional regulator [Azoarcus sp.]|nr:sigma-54 dependent transcriptional regulator [Azoarcus sp.]
MNIADRRHTTVDARDVLVVDDEEDIRELLELSLLRMGLSADAVGSLAEARACLERARYRMCLTDMRLPDGDGLELVEHISCRQPGLPVAVITAFGSIETAIRALKLGAFDFVTKPIELQVLRELVSHALKLKSPETSGEASGDESEVAGRSLVGSSRALASLRIQIAKLARSQAPVFIHGESGTGKEVIARLIHGLGARAAGSFVAVNCGAIPSELMESEFFGYRKGSFNEAKTDKNGLFQAAHGGTLFLDEVAELPLAMQVKLLRAIQERAVRPVGAQTEETVDVRILSASHRDLAQLVAENRFRQDLYFRINVITLRVPPLRERPEDIPELAGYVLKRLAERDGSPRRRLSAAALAALGQYTFPGNVRELENLLERACALCDDEEIGVEDLGLDGSMSAGMSGACAFTGEAMTTSNTVMPMTYERGNGGDEKTQILRTLDELRWNRTAAAQKLGMTLRQLRYRLQKWGMD